MISQATDVTVTIDGRTVTVPRGTTVWEAAQAAGIDIPVLCHSERMDPVGVCRMCVVDVGERVLAASCVRECGEGMTVETDSPKVAKQRRVLTELLLSEHPTPCERETTTGDCELEELGRRFGLVVNGMPGVERSEPPESRLLGARSARPQALNDSDEDATRRATDLSSPRHRSRSSSLYPLRSVCSGLR